MTRNWKQIAVYQDYTEARYRQYDNRYAKWRKASEAAKKARKRNRRK